MTLEVEECTPLMPHENQRLIEVLLVFYEEVGLGD